MGGKAARNKGLNFEREIARELRGVFPGCTRHLEVQAEQALGYDLDETEDWYFQLKRNKKYAPLSAIKEIQPEGKHALITKGDREKTIVALYLEDFIELLKASKREKMPQIEENDDITADQMIEFIKRCKNINAPEIS